MDIQPITKFDIKPSSPLAPKRDYKAVLLMSVMAVVVVAIVVLIWVFLKPAPVNTPATKTYELKEYNSSVLPQYFPSDLPMIPGSEVVQNYNTYSKTKTQATRKLFNTLSVAENYRTYKAYFVGIGWRVSDNLDKSTDNFKEFFANDPASRRSATVDISDGKFPGKTMVFLNFFVPAKP